MGLFSGKEDKANVAGFNSQADAYLMNQLRAMNDTTVNKLTNDYAAGKISLQDLLANDQVNNSTQGWGQGVKAGLATDPLSGTKLATDQVQNNDILGQLFGKDSTLSRTVGDEQNLASRGYSLQPEDYEAYGQASDQIARNFAQEGNSLSSMLADRGLDNSNVAASQFSGLAGNKNERLAQAQRQIADDRMKTNMERLGQTRNFLTSLSNQANNSINDQFQRNMTGIGAQQGFAQNQRDADMKAWQIQSNNELQAQASKKSEGGLMDAITGGITSGIGSGISSGIGGGINKGIGAGTNAIGGLFSSSPDQKAQNAYNKTNGAGPYLG